MRDQSGDDHPNRGPHRQCLKDHGGRGVPPHCTHGCKWPCPQASVDPRSKPVPTDDPIAVFEGMRAQALDMLKVVFMESERTWPGDDSPVVTGLFLPILGVGIATATEHYAKHPEHLALANSPICDVCLQPIQTLQVGVDPAPSEEPVLTRIAWPCGHRLP